VIQPGFSSSASPRTRRAAVRWAAVVIVLLGAGMRFAALTRDARFHPDEALFATFARGAAVHGDWLLTGELDKPPLALYASALSMALTGVRTNDAGVLDLDLRVGEFAARLPSALAGVVWVAVLMALARRLYRRPVFALWAGLLGALSPMAILFGASAFTDGWLLLWLTASLWAASGARWGLSGLLLGLAFATKAQGLVYAPLALGVGWALHGLSPRAAMRLLLPVIAAGGLLAAWDGLRAGSPPLFALAAARNAPGRLVRAAEVAPRALAWLASSRGLFGPSTALFALLIGAFNVRSLFRRPRTPAMTADLVLLSFTLGYALAHWLIAFNTYDRYWLPLVPPLALLAVRAGVWAYAGLSRFIPRAELQLVALALAAVLLASGLDAGNGKPGYNGGDSSFAPQPAVDEAGRWLAGQHVAAVIYDPWLGWQLGYYLGAWSDKRRVYYPTPGALAAGARALDEREPRFLPVPNAVNQEPWLTALADAGFHAEIAFETGGVSIYRLEPPVR